MARRRPRRGVARDRHRRSVPRRRAHREVAHPRARRLRGAGGGRRPRLRPRLPGDAGHPHHGRPRAAPGPRRGDRGGPLDAGMAGHLPQHRAGVRHRTPGHADRRRRPRPRPGRCRHAVVLRHRHRRSTLADRHRGRLRRHRAGLRGGALAARGGRPADHAARGRARRHGRGVRQGDGRRGVARDRDGGGGGLLVADRDHRGGRAAVDRLAPRGGHVARPGERRRLVAARLPGRERPDDRHAGPQRALPAHLAGRERGPDAGPQPRPSGGPGGLDGRQPQPHRPPGAELHDVDADRDRRRHLRAQQLRRAARRGRGDGRAAVVERPAGAPGPLGELAHRAAPGPHVHLRRDRRPRHRALLAGRLRGGRPDAPADAHHPHSRRRLRPLARRRPPGAVGAPGVREPPRVRAQRRRGGARVARRPPTTSDSLWSSRCQIKVRAAG